MSNQRFVWADSLKGWLMILVIIGHIIQCILEERCNEDHVWNLIYSFHMPAFIAVSGWFAYHRNRIVQGNTCKRRCYQLLFPYLLWSVISFILRGNHTIPSLLKIVFCPDSYFWFLWVLFWISVLFILSQIFANKLHIDELFPVVILNMVLVGVMVCLDFRMFGFQFLAYYFLFYTLGYCIHRFKVLQISNNVVLIGLTIIWAFLAWFWSMHELPSWMPVMYSVPASLMQYIYRGLTAVIAILVIIGVAPKLLNGTSYLNSWIKDWGTISLGIYVIHLVVMGYVVKVVKSIMPELGLIYWGILIFVLTLASSVIIVRLLMRNKWTMRYLLGKL